ncbi:hypothetical protein KM043_003781 [Ampulex compressa]|nr:hypothetical protein KM043_003781 [Ampulex compressa]
MEHKSQGTPPMRTFVICIQLQILIDVLAGVELEIHVGFHILVTVEAVRQIRSADSGVMNQPCGTVRPWEILHLGIPPDPRVGHQPRGAPVVHLYLLSL